MVFPSKPPFTGDFPLLQCEVPKIAFSWFVTPITMVYGLITIVTGA